MTYLISYVVEFDNKTRSFGREFVVVDKPLQKEDILGIEIKIKDAYRKVDRVSVMGFSKFE